jgi:hypothetical protein
VTIQVSVNKMGKGGARTIATFEIDDEDPDAPTEWSNAPDMKTSVLIRRALDELEAEAETFKKRTK